MNKSILALALLTASTSAIAEKGDLWLNIHIASKHSSDGYYDQRVDWEGEANNESAYREYNEVNPGLGLTYEVEDFLDVRGGFYKNSVHEQSVYAGGSIHTSNTNFMSIGALFGAITGYDAQFDMSVIPMVVPYVSLNTKYVRAEVTFMPGFGDHDSVAGLTLAVTF